MLSLIEKSFSLNLRGMRVFALYPPETSQRLYQVFTVIVFFCLVVPVPILQCLYLYLKEDVTFKEIAENTFLIAELACFIPKFWPFVPNGLRIKKCIHYFDEAVFKAENCQQEEILKNGVKVCRITTRLFLSCVSGGFLTWSLRPIAWKGHIFPTNIWLPFDLENAPTSYIVFAYAYLIIAVGYGAFASAAVDSLVAGLAYQATTQIKMLKNKLQFLAEHVEEELGSKGDLKERELILHRKAKECVIYHNLILDFVEEYKKCFSQMAFSQIGSGVIVFCVSVLQLTIVEILSFDFLAMIMFLIAMLSEVYIYCHFGTVLFEENNTLNDAIYLSRWYEFDTATKKVIMLIMKRAQKPMIIPVGKIFDMSLVTFTMIVRRAYSLLAVLENYNIDLK